MDVLLPKILLAVQLLNSFHVTKCQDLESGDENIIDNNCVNTFHELENSLLSNQHNIDSLFTTFFKANRGHPQVYDMLNVTVLFSILYKYRLLLFITTLRSLLLALILNIHWRLQKTKLNPDQI